MVADSEKIVNVWKARNWVSCKTVNRPHAGPCLEW